MAKEIPCGGMVALVCCNSGKKQIVIYADENGLVHPPKTVNEGDPDWDDVNAAFGDCIASSSGGNGNAAGSGSVTCYTLEVAPLLPTANASLVVCGETFVLPDGRDAQGVADWMSENSDYGVTVLENGLLQILGCDAQPLIQDSTGNPIGGAPCDTEPGLPTGVVIQNDCDSRVPIVACEPIPVTIDGFTLQLGF